MDITVIQLRALARLMQGHPKNQTVVIHNDHDVVSLLEPDEREGIKREVYIISSRGKIVRI